MASVLLVAQRESFKDDIRHILEADFNIYRARTLREATRSIDKFPIDIVITDITLLTSSDRNRLLRARKKYRHESGRLSFIFVFYRGEECDPAVEDIISTEYSILTLPGGSDDRQSRSLFLSSVSQAMTLLRYRRMNSLLQHENRILVESTLPAESQLEFNWQNQIYPPASFTIGNSAVLRKLHYSIRKVSNNKTPVFLLSEKGTEKELIARHLHELSVLSEDKPFYTVDIKSIDQHLQRFILFGSARKTFRELPQKREGIIEKAAGGTVYISNVDHLSWQVQSELLETISRGSYIRAGEKRRRPIAARLIFSSCNSIEKLIDEGIFRQDLYHKLSSFLIQVPTLEQRREDIPLIIDRYMQWYCERYEKNTSISGFLKTILSQRHWPGNTGELYELLHRMLSLSSDGQIDINILSMVTEYTEYDRILKETLGTNPVEHFLRESGRPGSPSLFSENAILSGYEPTLHEMEKEYIIRVLESHRWNISEAARILDISRKTLYEKIKKYGLKQVKSG